MPVANISLNIYQGDDYVGLVRVTNVDGTPADLTGYTAQAQIRRAVADTDPVVVAEIATLIAGNIVNLSVAHAVTVALSGRYVWDLQLISGAGTITTIAAGKVPITQEVTRAAA